MSENLRATGEQGFQSEIVSEWDNLTDSGESWEEHLKKAQEAYVDGLLELPLDEIQKSIANDVSNIMETEAESEKNKMDYETSSSLQQEFDNVKRWHEDAIRGERIQEELEKDLNRRLVKINDLENLANIDGSGVGSSELDYYDKKVNVLSIDLDAYQGEPLNLLTHSIDFKQTKTHEVIGQGTSNTLRALPNIWLSRETQVEQLTDDGRYKDGYNVRSNVIFTTYSNPENPNSKPVGGDIIYGFDHVDANSILKVSPRDGNTPLELSYRLSVPSENDLNFFDQVENGASNGSHNEVAIRRYDETGKPRIPDYLVTYNGSISEDAKNHAATFNIPIINLVDHKNS